MLVSNGKKNVLTSKATFKARYEAMGYKEVKPAVKQPAEVQKASKSDDVKGGKENGGAGK